MKKRKELDALVANGKRIKKAASGSSCSAHELLRHDTDSSDVEDFAAVSSRKSRKKSSGHLPLTSICVPLCQFVLVTMCILISATLVWLHIGLREDLDVLRAHIQQVEAGNKNTPELIHSLHNDLQNLEANVTALFLEIKKNMADVNNATKEIEKLKIVTSKLQDSVDAAPALKQLPKNVESLSESVVTFGSKISALESSMKELKDFQSSVQSSTRDLFGELDAIKATVHDLANSTKSNANDSRLPYSPLVRDLSYQTSIEETKRRVSFLESEVQDLGGSVHKMKSTLSNDSKVFSDIYGKIETVNDGLISALNETHTMNSRMSSLENYTFYNLASRIEHFETEGCKCSSSSPGFFVNMTEIQSIVNNTIFEAVVDIVNSGLKTNSVLPRAGAPSEVSIKRAQDVLLLLRGLLTQFSHVPLPQTLTEETVTEIFAQLLNSTCRDLTKDEESKELVVDKSSIVHTSTESANKVVQPTTVLNNHDTVSSYVTSVPSSGADHKSEPKSQDTH